MGEMFRITHERTIIGRGQRADVRMMDEGVSREHCEIAWNAALDFPRRGVILPNNEPSIPYTSMGTMLLALCSYTSMLVGELSAIRTSLGLPDSASWCLHRD